MAMNKKQVLGKGLGALIPTASGSEEPQKGILYCSIDKIHANPNQPRKLFNESSLTALAETIKEKGILQPLLVRKSGKSFELIAGERRLRASKMAGLKDVPVLVREAAETDSLELSVLENIQREDLNPIEEAKAYQEMLDQLDLTQEKLAHRVGKDRSSITNAIRLLQLPKEIHQDLIAGDLSAGHARALLGLTNELLQLKVGEEIKKKGLSVRAAEKLIQRYKEGSTQKPPSESFDPDMQELEDELCRYFSARVKVHKGKKGGKIQIMYSSPEELDRIYSLLFS